MNFKDIPILDWGNTITMKGIVMQDNSNDTDITILLPAEKPNPHSIVMRPSTQEWFDLNEQLDQMNVIGEEGNLVKKSIRQLDQKICWAVYRRDKYKCRYCGIDNVPLTVDHIVTWETGGATHEKNLLTCCRKCNRKRGNLDYGSWMQHKYYIERSKFLSEKVREENEKITRTIKTLPTNKTKRTR